MKRLIILCTIALSTASGLFAQTIPFDKFDKNKIDVGTLYVYDYSKNKEDFQLAAQKYIYIKSVNDIEVLSVSYEDTLELPDVFKYRINWDYMMLEKEDYSYAGNQNDIPIGFVSKININVDFQKKIFESKTFGKSKNGLSDFNSAEQFESIPTYFYQYTDLMDLWFALRFYPLTKDKITVNSLTSNYNVDLDIKYEGKEEVKVPHGKVLCYKFSALPQVSFLRKLFRSPKNIYFWLTSENEKRYMVKYRNDNEQYTVIQSMEYRLAEMKKITSEEWEQFKKAHISKRLKK